ncbi:hypothetical protein CRUP_027699, partial [Coryphaenoides rupestris]
MSSLWVTELSLQCLICRKVMLMQDMPCVVAQSQSRFGYGCRFIEPTMSGTGSGGVPDKPLGVPPSSQIEPTMSGTGSGGVPAIKEKFSDWTDFLVQELTGSRTAPANLLEGPMRGKNTVDLVVEGSLMEVRDPADPALYWPARVVRNVGGRLRLRYVGLAGGGAADEDRPHPQQQQQQQQGKGRDFWLFYLDTRLRPMGWATENSLSLEPPT